MIWVDGKLSDCLPVCDRGLAYGDGFFTTVLVLNGRLINWEKHEQRLRLSGQRLKFPGLNWPQLHQMLKVAEATFASNEAGVLKLMITRGCGGSGYQPAPISSVQPRYIVQKLPYPKTTEMPLKIAKNNQAWSIFSVKTQVCQTRWGQNRQLAGLKHLNRLENVLARYELADGITEGIMLNETGQVISGTQSNIVLLKGQMLWTPKLETCGIQGTLLASLKEWLPSLGYTWHELEFDLSLLEQAEEVFFCNAVRGIMPMESLNGQSWPVTQATRLQIQLMQYLTP